jgi:hypothetical protein
VALGAGLPGRIAGIGDGQGKRGRVVNRTPEPDRSRRLRGTTLVFDGPVNLDPRAVRLYLMRNGKRVRNLSRWVRVGMVGQNGQTWAYLRFRSPRGELFPRGRYSLLLQNEMIRHALTGAPLTGSAGSTYTEVRFERVFGLLVAIG